MPESDASAADPVTLIYFSWIHFYVGWEPICASRKVQFSCSKQCLQLFWGRFELIWDWLDIFHIHGSQTHHHDL